MKNTNSTRTAHIATSDNSIMTIVSASNALSPARKTSFLLLSLFFFGLFFFRLGNVPLFDLDEGLYVTCARQMAQTGDLVTPRLNGRLADRPGVTTVPFYEKPIMVYWLSAATMRLLGVSELAARLPAALAALLTTWVVLFAGTHWFGRRAGIIAALVYAACPLTIVDARDLTPDGLLVLWFTGALLTFRALKRPGAPPHAANQRRLVSLFWTLCALAVLTKGIIGVLLPLLIIGLSEALDHLGLRVRIRGMRRPFVRFALRLRAANEWRPTVAALRPLAGLLLFLALAVPWFALICRTGERDELGHTFVQEYIIRQHIGRFKGQDAVHNMPLPTYLAFFLIGFFPWSCIVPAAFRWRVQSGTRGAIPSDAEACTDADTARSAVEQDDYRFLLIWFWTVFVFFSLAAAKLPAYIAPAYPAAALLVGRWLDRALTLGVPAAARRSLRRAALGATVTGALLLAVALIGPRFAPANAPIPADVQRVVLHVTLLLTLGNALALACLSVRGAAGVRATVIAQAAVIGLVVGVGCTEGYAVVAQDVLLPYQRAAIAAQGDAARGIPVVFYNIIPRRPSMLYYAQYSPYEHKEPGLMPYLQTLPVADRETDQRRTDPKAVGNGEVDIVTSRATYERLLRLELAATPRYDARILAEYGAKPGGWLLLRLTVRSPVQSAGDR
jgi:4-amino-4-deoxy-L-arabinose transferase-like glycosyltransferase